MRLLFVLEVLLAEELAAVLEAAALELAATEEALAAELATLETEAMLLVAEELPAEVPADPLFPPPPPPPQAANTMDKASRLVKPCF